MLAALVQVSISLRKKSPEGGLRVGGILIVEGGCCM